MNGTRFNEEIKRLAATRLSRAGVLRGLGAGALAALLAAVGIMPAEAKKKKKKPVCLCPTAEATSCTEKHAKIAKVRKLATQACNYQGRCRPGKTGAQCLCPTGQTLCGTTCADLQTDPANCGVCGTVCAAGQACVSASCCLPATANLQAAIDAISSGATLRLCAGTWTLASTVQISKTLTIAGVGAAQTVLDGNNAVRVLQIAVGADVSLRELTVTKGMTTGATYPNNVAGGILNEGTLRLSEVDVTGHNSAYGAGLYNAPTGTLRLHAGSHVTDNRATSFGGGIANNGMLTLEGGSQVTGNSATAGAGGIDNVAGTLALQDGSRVAGNTAAAAGGVFNLSGTVNVAANALICDNIPPGSQCGGPGTFTGPGSCPSPASGVCPPSLG
jgi:hypothetical protein